MKVEPDLGRHSNTILLTYEDVFHRMCLTGYDQF